MTEMTNTLFNAAIDGRIRKNGLWLLCTANFTEFLHNKKATVML